MTEKKKRYRETEHGLQEWNEEGQFWVRVFTEEEQKERLEDKIPAYCPACNHFIDNWKAKNYYLWGVCYDCYIEHIEGRELSKEKDLSTIRRVVKEKIELKKKAK